MTILKSSGLIIIVLSSIALVLFSYPSNHEIQTQELPQEITTGSSTPSSDIRLSLAQNHKTKITRASSVDAIDSEFNDMVEEASGLDNVTGQQLCALEEYYCDSNEADLYRLIAIIESSTDNELIYSLVKKLWYMAADLGAPEAAIAALKYQSWYADEKISDLATRAYNDLIRVSEKSAIQLADGASENAMIRHQDPANISGESWATSVATINNQEAQTLGEIQELRMVGLNERKAEKRLAAVRNLLRYREVEVIDALIGATHDTDNNVRRHAVNALWIVGSDNINEPAIDQVLSALNLATMDTDPEVADLAIKALEDFQSNFQSNKEASRLLTDLTTRETIREDLDVAGISISN